MIYNLRQTVSHCITSSYCPGTVFLSFLSPIHTPACQVVSLRLPADDVERFLPQILEGCLLWAEDSKNKFRAKVGSGAPRAVVLANRCAVAQPALATCWCRGSWGCKAAELPASGAGCTLQHQASTNQAQPASLPPLYFHAGAVDCGETGQAVRL